MEQETKAQYDLRMEQARLEHEIHRGDLRSSNQSAIEFSSIAAKALLLTNGGAVIAVLGFVATIAGGDGALRIDIRAAADALVWFAWGVAASVVVSLLSYLVMYLEAEYEARSIYVWEYPFILKEKGANALWWMRVLTQLTAFCTAISALVFFFAGIDAVVSVVNGSTTEKGANCWGLAGNWWFFCRIP